MGALAFFPGLGSAQKLTYHEAIVAQSAREMIASGDLVVPTIGGQPWLEKPPLAIWLVALCGRIVGRVDETIARFPSAVGAILLAWIVARLTRRLINPRAGWLAGAILMTTAWTSIRGRLADVDLLLTALVTAALAAWPDLPTSEATTPAFTQNGLPAPRNHRAWLAFFALLGATAWAKGVGFGACLILAILFCQALWNREIPPFCRRFFRPHVILGMILAGAWPCLVWLRHPRALGLWIDHSLGRLLQPQTASGFAGEPWPAYLLEALGQLLPWVPLSIIGIASLWRQARGSPCVARQTRVARFLVCWAAAPVILVSLTRSRNAHYLLPALPAYAIAAAITLDLWLNRICEATYKQHMKWMNLRHCFVAAALLIGVTHVALIPLFPGRGAEWAWYRDAAAQTTPREPLYLLYSDWDRLPYPTPFGPMPHDLPIRLFYLDRPVQSWYSSPRQLQLFPPTRPFAIIARDRDRRTLESIGRATVLSRGPVLRARHSRVDDRAFILYRVVPTSIEQSPVLLSE
jgi:4-amino-4-deoxy-L-arabinose transferase-like glycosyltransferase